MTGCDFAAWVVALAALLTVCILQRVLLRLARIEVYLEELCERRTEWNSLFKDLLLGPELEGDDSLELKLETGKEDKGE